MKTIFPTYYKSPIGEGFLIYDLAKEMVNKGHTLTFNENYLNPEYIKEDYQETCFKEIQNIGMVDEDLQKKQTLLTDDFDTIIKSLKKALKNYLIDTWDSKRKKVMMHSAGYDSRIISGILTELREEKGRDWIGEIHFRCHQPEGEMFKRIMKLEGWDRSQYSLWEDVQESDNHYNLGRIEPVNGFITHIQQFEFFSDIVDNETILIGGVYGGEMFDYPSRKKPKFTDYNYCENKGLNSLRNYIIDEAESVSKYHADSYKMVCPFLSVEYLKIATRVPSKFIVRPEDAEYTDPDIIRTALAKSFKFDIFDIPYVGHDYTWNITNERFKEMQEFYDNSLFFNEYGIALETPIDIKTHESNLWAFAVMYEYIYKK